MGYASLPHPTLCLLLQHLASTINVHNERYAAVLDCRLSVPTRIKTARLVRPPDSANPSAPAPTPPTCPPAPAARPGGGRSAR